MQWLSIPFVHYSLNNEIDDKNIIGTCFAAFLADEAKENAVKWLKGKLNFGYREIHDLILKFGIESEDFSLTAEIVDDDDDE